MPGERELGDGSEDAHPVVGVRIVRRQDEGRLREVRPVREPLHLLGVEIGGVEHDRDGVAAVGHRREHVDLAEWSLHGVTVAPVGPRPW